ncbi:unnamed protein product [Linum trigynum]|uniref:Kinesin motor domain-containing protein n=1 Tax=Linum trigynum TaxID=586398 RepID=A0AAV2FRN4_9ROSI
MNGMGRQGQRSGAGTTTTVHHHIQYSDNFVDTSSSGRWLQSAGLQHLQNFSSDGASSIPPLRFPDLSLISVSVSFPSFRFIFISPTSSFVWFLGKFDLAYLGTISCLFGREYKATAGLQHLQNFSSNGASSIPSLQDYNFYGGGDGGGLGQGMRVYRNAQRGFNGGAELYTEPSTPPVSSRQTGQRKSGVESPTEFSPGILELHSFDTELLPEFQKCTIDLLFFNLVEQESLMLLSLMFQAARAPAIPDDNVLKSFAADKEKTSYVAKIKVVVRKRPMNKELAKKFHETKLKVDLTGYIEKHEFVFDAVLNEEVSNDEVYHETVEPIVPIIFQCLKATCFAYGQTGSGKTYNMKPLPLRASGDILRLMQHTYRNQGFQLLFSFFEIYGGKLYDLLSDRKKLCMREDGKQQVCIVGLQEYRVSDVKMIEELIERGNATRSTGTTGANEESSRSHAILQLAVKRTIEVNETKLPCLVKKLYFIDLAGSERGADTTDNDKHTRGSKLIEVLRDSFVGNSRTVMISCISPSSGSCEHTLNTLRYVDRVKSLSKGNTSKKDTLSSTLNMKESIAMPLSSILPAGSSLDDDVTDAWVEQDEGDDFKDVEDYEPEKPVRREIGKLAEAYNPPPISEDKSRKPNGQTKFNNLPKPTNIKKSEADDDLSSLLKEEEDLVSAHRKQVEDTMNIVKEEMNLLVEADQQGNQLDDYITRDHNVLVASSGY